MNTYFSKTERELFLQLDLLLGTATRIIQAYEDTPSPDKEFMKNLKTGRTYLEKALTRRYVCLADGEEEKFRNMVKRYRVTLLSSDYARAHDKKIREEMDVIQVTMDDFMDWYCVAIPFTCGKCYCHGDTAQQKKCSMRKFMEKYDIFPVNTHATGDECEYDYLAAGIDLDEMERKVKDGEVALDKAQKELANEIEKVN